MRCLDLVTHNERQGLSTFPVERSGTTEQNEFCGVYFVYTLNGINYKLGRYRGIAAAKSIHPRGITAVFQLSPLPCSSLAQSWVFIGIMVLAVVRNVKFHPNRNGSYRF